MRNYLHFLLLTLPFLSHAQTNVRAYQWPPPSPADLFAQAGENRVPLELGDLPAGLYFMQVRDVEGNGLVLKMVKDD